MFAALREGMNEEHLRNTSPRNVKDFGGRNVQLPALLGAQAKEKCNYGTA